MRGIQHRVEHVGIFAQRIDVLTYAGDLVPDGIAVYTHADLYAGRFFADLFQQTDDRLGTRSFDITQSYRLDIPVGRKPHVIKRDGSYAVLDEFLDHAGQVVVNAVNIGIDP